jgi:6-phosphogluconolactonase
MKNLLLVSLTLFTSFTIFSQSANEYYLLAGTYTSGKSEGIYVYKFNAANGESKYISAAKTSNPSFLAISPDEKFVYAVNENADSTRFTVTGYVASFSFNKKSGTLTFINRQESGGKHPCYVAVDKTGKWIFAGNYSSGSLALFHVNKNGNLDKASQVIQHSGKSIVKGRQDEPHVHSTFISNDNKTLYVSDLGTDKLMMYQFNNKSGKLSAAPMPFVSTKPGSGPRHFDIHPNGKFAYLMEELSGGVSVFQLQKNGGLSFIQNISGLPRDFSGIIGSADIHVSPDGKFLYCSNRGESNTIGILKIDEKTGLLTWVGAQSTLGIAPRNFSFDPTGNFLLVANQSSDEIVIFNRNKETGLLTDSGKRISIPSPVCIKWIKAN